MLKRILVVALLLSATMARAGLANDYKLILLTENFPPFSMAAIERTTQPTTTFTASTPTSFASCSSAPASITA